MPKITNHKLINLSPTWADFRGFSLLFDNPNPAINLLNIENNLQKIDCSESDTSIQFYQILYKVMDTIGLGNSANSYLFCPLPISSYHVTYLDGINDVNKKALNPLDRIDFNTFLKDLPISLTTDTRFTYFQKSRLSKKLQKPIHFEFDTLSNWGNKVLAAQLKPRAESMDIYQALIENRRKNFKEFLCKSGFSEPPKLKDYTPHISLGYFANKDDGALSLERIEGWTNLCRKAIEDKTISFNSFSLYGFTDMTTFIKPSQ